MDLVKAINELKMQISKSIDPVKAAKTALSCSYMKLNTVGAIDSVKELDDILACEANFDFDICYIYETILDTLNESDQERFIEITYEELLKQYPAEALVEDNTTEDDNIIYLTTEESEIIKNNVNQIIHEVNSSKNVKLAIKTSGYFCYDKVNGLYDIGMFSQYNTMFSKYIGPCDDRIIKILDYVSTENNEKIYTITLLKLYESICQHLDKCEVTEQKAEIPPERQLTEMSVLLLEILGDTGMYDKSTIYSEFKRLWKERHITEGDMTDGTPLYWMNRLIEDGYVMQGNYLEGEIISIVSVSSENKKDDRLIRHPMESRYYIYALTEKGRAKYEKAFHSKPVEPGYKAIIRTHDNLSHGLGINICEAILKRSVEFYFVSTKRKETTIPLLGGTTYIPDLLVKSLLPGSQVNCIMLFEYELPFHVKSNFKEKLDKALKAVRQLKGCAKCINIVTNNKESASELREDVDAWVDKIGTLLLENIKLRITSLRCIADAVDRLDPITRDENWLFVYDFNKGPNPRANRPLITFNKKKSTQF